MDGPTANWSVMDKLNTYRSENELASFFEIGSCGLHIVHGAFKTGVIATNWELDKVFLAMLKLLNDSPARRDVYKTVNGTNEFLLHFCKTYWVEDEPVAACAIDVWPNIVQLIKHYKSLSRSQQPKNSKLYDCLLKHVDNLML